MRMRRIIICLARLYNMFPQCPINATIFEKNMLLNMKCVWILYYISPYKKNWAGMIKNLY
jgi:hypothetical protein